jgi:hypothetical protein
MQRRTSETACSAATAIMKAEFANPENANRDAEMAEMRPVGKVAS